MTQLNETFKNAEAVFVNTSVRIGDKLVSLQQGVHSSISSGFHRGNGEYTINMKDGGNGNQFVMRFKLVATGGGNFALTRIDVGAPLTNLADRGNGALAGGAYLLNFR